MTCASQSDLVDMRLELIPSDLSLLREHILTPSREDALHARGTSKCIIQGL